MEEERVSRKWDREINTVERDGALSEWVRNEGGRKEVWKRGVNE